MRPRSIRHRRNELHARARLLKKCGDSLGNWPRSYCRLQIPAQVLIAVEFEGMRPKVELFDLFGVFRDSLADAVGVMHAQVVGDQEHLVPGTLNQILEGEDEVLCIGGVREDGETHQPLIGDGLDHRCRSVATDLQPEYGRQACNRVAPNPVRILANGGLVTPVDLDVLSLCVRQNLWRFIPEPRFEAGRILLDRTFDRSLRRETPAPRVLAHGVDGQCRCRKAA